MMCCVLISSSSSVALAVSSDWPQFQYDAQHTGYNPHATVQPGLDLKFQHPFATTQLRPVSVYKGLAASIAYKNPPTDVDTIFCYDAETGEIKWKNYISPNCWSTAQAVAGYDRWYVQATRDNDGWVSAHDLYTGEQLWLNAYKTQGGDVLAPVLYDSVLFHESGTYGGCEALDAMTGETIWWQWWYQILGWSPSIFRDSVYGYLEDRFVGSAVDGQEKVEIVSYTLADAPCLPDDYESSGKLGTLDTQDAVVFDTTRGIALFCERYALWAFDMNTRDYLWKKCDTFSIYYHWRHRSMPAIKDGMVYMPTRGHLGVYDIMTGEELWTFNDTGYFGYPPVLTNDYVFVSSQFNTYMVDLETHQKVWEYPAGGYLSVANDMLYIGGYLGEVYAFGPVPTDVADDPDKPIPSDYSLSQNYPNPFNPSTTIEFALPRQAHVRLSIYNVLGQEVVTLVNGPLAAGTHTRQWLGRDAFGNAVSSGIYFYRIQSKDQSLSRKMLLLK